MPWRAEMNPMMTIDLARLEHTERVDRTFLDRVRRTSERERRVPSRPPDRRPL
jgi:hypothetical protein